MFTNIANNAVILRKALRIAYSYIVQVEVQIVEDDVFFFFSSIILLLAKSNVIYIHHL